MEPVKQDFSSHYIAHAQAITDTQKRLEKLETSFAGMPQEIQFIKTNVDKVCVSMEKLIERLDTKFVPREMFDANTESMQVKIDDLRAEYSKEVTEIKDQNKWLVRGLIAALLAAGKDLIHLLLK